MKRMSDLSWPEGVATVTAEDRQALGEALADQVAQWLREALGASGEPRVSLALSGGSTPVPFFQALARKPLSWDRVCVLLVDERWVPEEHAASNARLVREHLLQGAASEATFLSMVTEDATPEEGQSQVEKRLSGLRLPLDVVVLGMGNDGHTASLFPGTPGLAEALDPAGTERCRAMTPPGAEHARMTLTRPVIAGAQHRVLHIAGEEKLDTLAKALAQPDDERAMPIRAFLRSGLTVYWSA
ncbi:6-phosphogluconolactonase [Marinobacteraceae bacterium S3BR75-40.1]